MRKTLLKILGTVVLVSALSGCSTTSTTTNNSKDEPKKEVIQGPGKDFDWNAKVEPVKFDRTYTEQNSGKSFTTRLTRVEKAQAKLENKKKSISDEKVKSELDEYFQQNDDVYFVNKVLEQINEKEEVQLPETFLVKWLVFSNQNITSEEQAKEILEAEKKQIKYQIIEGKLMSDNDIKIDYAEVLAQAEQLVRNQLAIYGIHHLSDEEIQKYAVEMLKDQEQVRQVSSEVAMTKLKDIILEKATKKETKISHDEFLEVIKK